MNKNLEFEDVDVGIWTALFEKVKEINEKSCENCGFGWEICDFQPFYPIQGRGSLKTRMVFVPDFAVINRNFGKIPPLRGLVRSFSMEKLLFEGRENGGK